MKKSILIIAGIFLLAIAALAAYVLRTPEAASAPVEAVPLKIEATTTPAAPEQAALSLAGVVVFTLSQAESEARFSIDEVLSGVPTTAVGVTSQVAAEIAIDFDNPANSQLGVITINARTLTTDKSNRNRMIQNEILDTAEFEFITFTPTAITGLPATITPGQTVTFQVTGGLTIRAITVTQTFEITATVDADGRLSGHGLATILRADYDLIIPSVAQVASVSEEVVLEIDFTAFPK